MVITVYSQAHFAQVFDGRQLSFPVQNIADGKVFAVTNFADLADGGTYTGSSERLMSRVSSRGSCILRQNTDLKNWSGQNSVGFHNFLLRREN
jgi:hypothetical protein